MTIAITLILITVLSVFISKACNQSIEKIIPLVFFSIPVFLLPFYCFNILLIGKIALLILIISIIAFGVYCSFKSKISILDLIKKFSPAVLIFAILSICYFIFLRDNVTYLWDELRLWSAVPKAIFSTNKLQLGSNSLIYPNMQSYPPGMALLIYFFCSFTAYFGEHYLFICYALLASVVILPALKNLKWKQWPVFTIIAVFITLIPCIFTSHGGDSSYFYKSLFIDGVLGIVIGYVFYLASQNPFSTKFKLVEFCITIAFVINLKDSAISFVIVALILAIILQLLNKVSLKQLLKPTLISAISIAIPYLFWKITLASFGVVNHLSMTSLFPKSKTLEALIEKILNEGFIQLNGTGFTLYLSIYTILFIIITVFFILRKHFEDISLKTAIISFSLMFASFIIFALGYLAIFEKRFLEIDVFLSFPRYFTTIVFMFFIFAILYLLPFFIDKTSHMSLNQCIFTLVLSAFVVNGTILFYQDWNKKFEFSHIKIDSDNVAGQLSSQIIQSKSDFKHNVYLLIPYDCGKKTQVHHRIYFNLLDTDMHIKNYCSDTNIIASTIGDNYENFNTTDSNEIKEYAQKWEKQLLDDNYEYVYVYSTNESVKLVFEQLGCDVLPEQRTMYKVIKKGEKIQLKLA